MVRYIQSNSAPGTRSWYGKQPTNTDMCICVSKEPEQLHANFCNCDTFCL